MGDKDHEVILTKLENLDSKLIIYHEELKDHIQESRPYREQVILNSEHRKTTKSNIAMLWGGMIAVAGGLLVKFLGG